MKTTFALQDVRFWNLRGGCMLTSKVGCVTAFRNYIGVAESSGFSDLDTTPDPNNFIPMLSTGVRDAKERMTFEGDVVVFDAGKYTEGEISGTMLCEIVYDCELGGFSLRPLETRDDLYPMWKIGKSIRIIGNKYEGYETGDIGN